MTVLRSSHAWRRSAAASMFSYVSAEDRVPGDHPLRPIRELVDEILRDMSRDFDGLYARVSRAFDSA